MQELSRYTEAPPKSFEAKKLLLLKEFKAAESNLDIINIYSYFYINCIQKVYSEGTLVNPLDAESFYLSILSSLSLILKSRDH